MSQDLVYPKGPEDIEGIKAYVTGIGLHGQTYHRLVERDAYRNILYTLGYHWIIYDRALNAWRPLALRKSTPRPVTNRVASQVNQGVSNLISYKPPITYSPTTDSPDDVAAASVADRVNTIIEKETNIRQKKQLIARWLRCTGNVFLVNEYGPNEDGEETFIQSERCTMCQTISTPAAIDEAGGMCPECQQQPSPPGVDEMTGLPLPTQPPFTPAVGSSQEPLGVSYPAGAHKTTVETVFSAWFDPLAASIYDSEFFAICHPRDRQWITSKYGKDVADRVTYDEHTEGYTRYIRSLAYAGAGSDRYPLSTLEPSVERAMAWRIWFKPNPDLAPNGIYATVIGGEVVENRDWPYHNEKNRPFLNVVHIREDYVPGRILGKPRLDDLIPLQDLRNQIQSIMQLHSTRAANSIWLVPEGVGIQKISGEQGQLLRYNALAGVPAPTRMSGDQLPSYLVAWLSLIDNDMDAVYGLQEVGRGEAPYKGASYAAIQLLDERQQQGQSSIMENWALGFMEWSKQHLNIWREYASEERTASLGFGRWSVAKFNKASLQGGVDLDVELGQNKPSTLTGKRAVVEQAMRLALISPMDPQERYRALEAIGASDLMADYKADQEKAARIVDQLAKGLPAPPPLPWDNHPIYLAALKRFMDSELFEQMPPPMQQGILQRAMYHFQIMQMQAKTAAMGPGQMTPKPMGPAGGSRGTAKGDQNSEGNLVHGEAQSMSEGVD